MRPVQNMIFEMEDIDIDDENDIRPSFPMPSNFVNAAHGNTKKIYEEKPNRILQSVAAKHILSDKSKPYVENKPTLIQKTGGSPYASTNNFPLQRNDTHASQGGESKPKARGRLLGNLNSLLTSLQPRHVNSFLPETSQSRIPDRKASSQTLSSIDSGIAESPLIPEHPRNIPGGKMTGYNDDNLLNDEFGNMNLPRVNNRPRNRLLVGF